MAYVFSRGICWSGLILNLFGWEVPCVADELVWGEAFEGFEASGEVVGVDEVAQVGSQLVVGLIESSV